MKKYVITQEDYESELTLLELFTAVYHAPYLNSVGNPENEYQRLLCPHEVLLVEGREDYTNNTDGPTRCNTMNCYHTVNKQPVCWQQKVTDYVNYVVESKV